MMLRFWRKTPEVECQRTETMRSVAAWEKKMLARMRELGVDSFSVKIPYRAHAWPFEIREGRLCFALTPIAELDPAPLAELGKHRAEIEAALEVEAEERRRSKQAVLDAWKEE